MNRMHPGQPPSRRKKIDPKVYISHETTPEPIILGEATIEHLQGSIREIRMTYWDGVVNGGYVDPIVFVIHNRSAYAKANGLVDGPILNFHSVTREGAVKMGLVAQVGPPCRPPQYEILLATGNGSSRTWPST